MPSGRMYSRFNLLIHTGYKKTAEGMAIDHTEDRDTTKEKGSSEQRTMQEQRQDHVNPTGLTILHAHGAGKIIRRESTKGH